MFNNTQTFDFGTNLATVVTKTNQDNNASSFRGQSTDELRHWLSIKHTLPGRGQAGESHLLRLDTEVYNDVTGAYESTASVWVVAKTFDNVQNVPVLGDSIGAIKELLSSSNIDRLLNSEA